MISASFHQKLSSRISENKLFGREQKLLCAVSGGLDSMVMVHALHALGYELEVAHVNFELRGDDSFLDEKLVQDWAGNHQLPFHLKRAGEGLKKLPGSLQENARNFRYEWLENLASERNIRHLLLAHHADDQVETILLQFFRGAGIRGLKGMSQSHNAGMRRRPLLSFSKQELLEYAEAEGLLWREDSSNSGDAYKRNKVRHHLIPLLEEIFPGFHSVILRNSERLALQAEALDSRYQNLYEGFLKEEKQAYSEFFLDDIAKHPLGKFFLTELLEQKGFSFSDAQDLSTDMEKTESRIRKNGDGLVAEFRYPRLILRQEKQESFPEIRIERAEQAVFQLSENRFLHTEISAEFPDAGNLFCWTSVLENLHFPLTFRLWKPGDRIAPKGMGGKKKKVSDVLSEARLSPGEKQSQYLLEDANGRVLWIPGIRESEPTINGYGFLFRLVFNPENSY
jgi:tRNA(Ile)-lysidine synthase